MEEEHCTPIRINLFIYRKALLSRLFFPFFHGLEPLFAALMDSQVSILPFLLHNPAGRRADVRRSRWIEGAREEESHKSNKSLDRPLPKEGKERKKGNKL